MAQYASEVIPVCLECEQGDFQNLTKLCSKCGISYCQHFSSEVDIRFCGNCMVDFKVATSTEIRTEESKNSAGVIVYSKRSVCKRLRLEGSDWLFTAGKISSLNDEDLDATIEYHRAIAGLMLSEREARRVEKYQQLNKQVISLKLNRSDVDSTGAIRGSLKTQKQKDESAVGKKSKTVKTTTKNDSNALANALALLLKQGFTPEQISALAGKK